MTTPAKVVKRNPNAVVAAGGSGAGVAAVWLLGVAGVDVSPELAAVIAGTIPTALLFVGRNGVKGTLDRVWRGGK